MSPMATEFLVPEAFAGLLSMGWIVTFAYPKQLTADVKPLREVPSTRHARNLAEMLILASIVVTFAVNGGLWVYLEEIGRRTPLNGIQISSILSAGMAAACISTLIVAGLGSRAETFPWWLAVEVEAQTSDSIDHMNRSRTMNSTAGSA